VTEPATKPELTIKQERFALAFLELGDASAAYRQVYDAAAMKATTINVKASELKRNPKVAARIAELQAQAAERAIANRAERIAREGERYGAW
jgi:hypothetical protein